mmetsp:Transcript_21331/g.36403  ORF Transcript_21331/g.36403 Transcript_21331/m.36403 type:complete len:388 (-) Transcript_21331:403-1566(-)
MPFETEIALVLFGIVIGVVGVGYTLLYVVQGEPSKHRLGKQIQRLVKTKSTSSSTSACHCEWFSILLRHWFEEIAISKLFIEYYEERLTHLFTKAVQKNPQVASKIESIACSELTLGSQFATFDNFTAHPCPSADNGTRFTFDVEYNGGIQFTINLMLSIKIPLRKKEAKIPCRFRVHCTEMRGKMALVIPGVDHPLCRLGFVDEPCSEFEVFSEIGGSGYQLKNMKKLHSFIISRLELAIRKDLVEPNGVCFYIPVKGDRKMHFKTIRAWAKQNGVSLPTIVSNDQSVDVVENLSSNDIVEENSSQSSNEQQKSQQQSIDSSHSSTNVEQYPPEKTGWLYKRGKLRKKLEKTLFCVARRTSNLLYRCTVARTSYTGGSRFHCIGWV